MKQLITIILVVMSTSLFSQTRIYYTQWKSEANYDVINVSRPYYADVILSKKLFRIEKFRMNADYILREVKIPGNGVIKIFWSDSRYNSMSIKQKQNLEKYFSK